MVPTTTPGEKPMKHLAFAETVKSLNSLVENYAPDDWEIIQLQTNNPDAITQMVK